MRRKLLIGLALGALVFGVSAVAIAAKDNRPQTDPVEATHTFRHIEGKSGFARVRTAPTSTKESPGRAHRPEIPA